MAKPFHGVWKSPGLILFEQNGSICSRNWHGFAEGPHIFRRLSVEIIYLTPGPPCFSLKNRRFSNRIIPAQLFRSREPWCTKWLISLALSIVPRQTLSGSPVKLTRDTNEGEWDDARVCQVFITAWWFGFHGYNNGVFDGI